MRFYCERKWMCSWNGYSRKDERRRISIEWMMPENDLLPQNHSHQTLEHHWLVALVLAQAVPGNFNTNINYDVTSMSHREERSTVYWYTCTTFSTICAITLWLATNFIGQSSANASIVKKIKSKGMVKYHMANQQLCKSQCCLFSRY